MTGITARDRRNVPLVALSFVALLVVLLSFPLFPSSMRAERHGQSSANDRQPFARHRIDHTLPEPGGDGVLGMSRAEL